VPAKEKKLANWRSISDIFLFMQDESTALGYTTLPRGKGGKNPRSREWKKIQTESIPNAGIS
jgi:hypothetical protein